MSVPDISGFALNGLHYAGGWLVNDQGSYIEHSGGNPSFATDVLIYPKEDIAICLLANDTQTDPIFLTESIKSILDGSMPPPYGGSIVQILDQISTWTTFIAALTAVSFFLLGLRRWRGRSLNKLSLQRSILIILWCIITSAVIVFSLILPSLFGSVWVLAFENRFYSMLTACIALILASCSVTWFVFARRRG